MSAPDSRPTSLAGDYRCRTCDHALTSAVPLPRCPQCGARRWRLVAWRPVRTGERPAAAEA